jgi:hypothetical protein
MLDLQHEMKARQGLEVRQQQMQSELHDAKMLMGHMKTENVSHKETIKQLQVGGLLILITCG